MGSLEAIWWHRMAILPGLCIVLLACGTRTTTTDRMRAHAAEYLQTIQQVLEAMAAMQGPDGTQAGSTCVYDNPYYLSYHPRLNKVANGPALLAMRPEDIQGLVRRKDGTVHIFMRSEARATILYLDITTVDGRCSSFRIGTGLWEEHG